TVTGSPTASRSLPERLSRIARQSQEMEPVRRSVVAARSAQQTLRHRRLLFHRLIRKSAFWLACELLNDLVICHNRSRFEWNALRSVVTLSDSEQSQVRLSCYRSHLAPRKTVICVLFDPGS